jgi:hypothetical protein
MPLNNPISSRPDDALIHDRQARMYATFHEGRKRDLLSSICHVGVDHLEKNDLLPMTTNVYPTREEGVTLSRTLTPRS